MHPLRGNKDPTPRPYSGFLTVPPLSLHPLPSLISKCLNLPLGTQGRPWRLNEPYFLKTRNRGGHRKAFVPRSPTGPAQLHYKQAGISEVYERKKQFVVVIQKELLTMTWKGFMQEVEAHLSFLSFIISVLSLLFFGILSPFLFLPLVHSPKSVPCYH